MAAKDFIIIGGGTAGLVVAARLTEDPSISVLVLEAGSDRTADPRINVPAMWPSVLGSNDFDWNYPTTPQKALNGRVIPISQGKLLGGTSAINGQAFVANSKAAVDFWAEMGNPGWDYQTLAPYYKKCHTLSRPTPAACEHLRLSYIDDEVRGTDGPIQASFPDEERDPLPAAWVDTLGALGYPTSGDPFSGEMFGGYINATSVDPRSRIRSYAANAYLQPVRDRPNLHVETDVTVEKIIFDSTGDVPKAVGVKVRQSDGSIAILEAAKEIILAAGAIGSPKLLELSGIGQRQRLEELGIAIVFDNPNVGENLQDHPVVALSFEAADGVKTLDALHRQEPEAIGAAMKAYAANKTGPFALGGNITGSLLPVADFVTGSNAETSLKEILDATADANIDPTSPFSARHGSFVRSLLSKPNEGAGNIFMWAGLSNSQSEAEETTGANPVNNVGNAGDRFISICAALLFPLSRGSVHITSNNPADIPAVDPRYMEHPLDIEVLARLLRYIDTIRQTEPLSLYLKEEGRRNNGAPSDLQDLDQVKEFIRKTARTCWHPTSTCAMLPLESGGVVDPKLRVHGVAGLRVVDSSVMPIATRGNPQTTVYAVAERAADLIRETHGKQV